MAANNFTRKIINGFECVTRSDLTGYAEGAMLEVEAIEALFSAIARLASGDAEIAALAALGKDNASLVHNDMDIIRERAEKAGIVG